MTQILFRKSIADNYEIESASKYFPIIESRTKATGLVIGRYSVLPYYRELEVDLLCNNSRLINTTSQHDWIADCRSWSTTFGDEDISRYTPRTYTNPVTLPEGRYVVKGITNSRKHNWNTHMFASDKKEAIEISNRLQQDTFYMNQPIVYREYVDLENFGVGINGLPISNEYRMFFYRENLLSGGFYWSEHEVEYKETDLCEAKEFAVHVAQYVSVYANFFVLDVAKTKEGKWILIEINDGQMSGLSNNDPDVLYRNLYDYILRNETP